jgi:hypothetical protein
MMADQKFFDFDAYMDERKGVDKPFVIKAFGEEHEIPNDVPFDVILEITRAQKEGQGQMTDDQMLEMANVMFGEDTFKKWLKKGIGLKGIMILTEKVMAMYMANASDMSQQMGDQKRNGNP